MAQRQRDLQTTTGVLAESLGEFNEAACHPAGHVPAIALDRVTIGVPELRGDGAQQPKRNSRLGCDEIGELFGIDNQRVDPFEGLCRRRSPAAVES